MKYQLRYSYENKEGNCTYWISTQSTVSGKSQYVEEIQRFWKENDLTLLSLIVMLLPMVSSTF